MSFSGQWIGITEAIRDLDAKDQRLSTLKKIQLNEVGRFMVNELKQNVHVWEKRKKGTHMRDTIGMTPHGDAVVVVVPKPYAEIENAREGTKPGHGPHNFADRAEATTLNVYDSKIRVRYDDFFAR